MRNLLVVLDRHCVGLRFKLSRIVVVVGSWMGDFFVVQQDLAEHFPRLCPHFANFSKTEGAI